MKNKFIVLDASCITYFIFFCLYNITTLDPLNREYERMYNNLFVFISLIIFIIVIIQEKINNKNINLTSLLKVTLPVFFFSCLYKFILKFFDIFDLLHPGGIAFYLSISIPILMLEFILEQLIYNFLRDRIIR
nr:MAG TPA: hypothetical protein [Caudoviricetes sp.]